MRTFLAALHLLALGMGLGAVWVRAYALRASIDRFSLQRAFGADMVWGISAVVWIGTGLWRLFGESEKPVSYYMRNYLFHMKLGLVLLIIVLELWPMFTLIRWRLLMGRGSSPEQVASPPTARRVATISFVQAALVVVIVFLAVAMARGHGVMG